MAGDKYAALTFPINFFTAHFKLHKVKRYRDTYMIPTPSTIGGIIGAIFGVPREKILEWFREKMLFTGAKLVEYDGVASDYETLLKFKNFNKLIRTPDKARIIINPTYIIAVAGERSFIEELFERIENLEFEFFVFGGNDYHFTKGIGRPKFAAFRKSKQGEGILPVSQLDNIVPYEGARAKIFTEYVRGDFREDFVFVIGGRILAKVEREVVDDGENRIFVYDVVKSFSI